MWVRIAVFLLTGWGVSSSSFATDSSCRHRLASPAVKHVTVARSHAHLAEAIPEYNAAEDFIFHFYPNGHVVLYTGRFFWESDGTNTKEKETMIRRGIAVVVHAGHEAVQRIERSILSEGIKSTIYAFTCHQRQLFLLFASGIEMQTGPFFLGSNVFDAILESGFVNAQNEPLPQTVYALEGAEENQLRSISQVLQQYELGGALGFFSGFAKALDYSAAELAEDIFESTKDLCLTEWVSNLSDPAKFNTAPQIVIDAAHDILRRAEIIFHRKLESLMGLPLRQLFPTFLTEGLQGKEPLLKPLFREALRESAAHQR